MTEKDEKQERDGPPDGQVEKEYEQTTQPPRGSWNAAQMAAQSRFDITEQASLGDYVLLESIGAGGMGQVFKAQHQRMERIVALKVLTASMVCDEKAIRRFHREVKAAAKLFHPNVVTAFDAGEQDGLHYLVMEFVDGCSLFELVQENGPLNPRAAVEYMLQAARGFHYAHSRNVVHRDIKPGNLMLSTEGAIKILDLGLARLQDEDSAAATASVYQLTQSGAIMGTLSYMSPEQISDASRVDHRSDIYSLGCTLYFLLIGKPVFYGDMIQTVTGHLKGAIPALRAARDDVPETLEKIYRRMLDKDRNQRYQTMEEVAVDLESYLSDSPLASGTSPAETILPRARPARPAKLDTVFDQAEDVSTISPQAPAVGLEFGTTSSSIAQIDEKGRATSLANEEGETTTSNMVCIDGSLSVDAEGVAGAPDAAAMMLGDGSGIMVGEQVLQKGAAKGRRIARAFKRELGRVPTHDLGDGNAYPPEVLSALIIRKLADDARRTGDFRHVVIAVPACFDDAQRKAVYDAATIAGLNVLTLVSEPLAAATAYADRQGLFRPESASKEPLTAVMYDLGGGVFDVSVVRISAPRIAVLATDGDSALGGCDWDSRLMDWVADTFKQEHSLDPRQDPVAALRLWRKCEVAKRTLSARDELDMIFDFRQKATRLHLSRDTLTKLCHDLLQRTEQMTAGVLKAAELDWPQVDCVLLMGGGSRMPMVHNMIQQLSRKHPRIVLIKDDLIAKGAALHAARELGKSSPDLPKEISDVNSRQLGVVGTDKRTGQKRQAVVIPRNTPLPTTVQQAFKTRKEGQSFLTVHIIQGNSSRPEECTSIGRLSIVGLPRDLPAKSPINADFRLAADGRLKLTVDNEKVPSAGLAFTRATGLSPEQAKFWRDWLDTMRLCGQFT